MACGVEKFLSLRKCAQLLKSKVLRASAGAVLQIPFIENIDIQDLKTHLPENCKIYLADSNLDLSGYILKSKEEENDSKKSSVRAYLDSLPASNYSDIEYFSKPDDSICLIVCGETGLNENVGELLKNIDCTRINIPMSNNVDSLNTGVAASIIMYEIKRQFRSKFS